MIRILGEGRLQTSRPKDQPDGSHEWRPGWTFIEMGVAEREFPDVRPGVVGCSWRRRAVPF
jgi:hypothetical protein